MSAAVRAGTAVVGAAAALLLVACGAASSGAPGPTRDEGGGARVAGLRGVHVIAVGCSPGSPQPVGIARALPVIPRKLVLCPLRFPATHTEPVEVSPVPRALLAALAVPDVPAPTATGLVCDLYMDVARAVFVVLPDGATYRLRIPEDAGCHHYLPEALTALDRYGSDADGAVDPLP